MNKITRIKAVKTFKELLNKENIFFQDTDKIIIVANSKYSYEKIEKYYKSDPRFSWIIAWHKSAIELANEIAEEVDKEIINNMLRSQW